MGYAAKKQTMKSIAQSGILYVPRRIQQGSGTLHLRTPTAPTALRPRRPQWEIIYSQRLFSIQGQRKRLDREAFLSSLCFLLWVRILRASAGGGIAWGRIRSPAGEPYLLKQSTELFPRAGFPISSSEPKKKRANQMIYSLLVGEDGFEPSNRNAADLQSVPFGHSGTPPDMKFCFV